MLKNHSFRFVLGVLMAAAVEILAKGPWAHAVWAPVIIMLFTDAEKVFGGGDQGTAAPPAAAATTTAEEAVTPNEKLPKK